MLLARTKASNSYIFLQDYPKILGLNLIRYYLKVPKCEIFDRSDFHDFYAIKSLWEGDFGVKIKGF